MKRKTIRSVIVSSILLLAVVLGISLPNQLLAQDDPEFTYAGEIDAPEFPDTLSWINVSEALTIDELEGKIVILDFWTYGCINCIHVIPDLRRLEEEYGHQLVVIGVHSAKFENEGQTENIRQIVQRYGVEHPVVNDSDFLIWRTYGVQAWPTLVLIDPLGKVVGGHAGEGIYPIFNPILEVMVEEYGAAGLLDDTPNEKFAPEIIESAPTPLSYPGKVLAAPDIDQLFISDTAHHRLIAASMEDFSQFEIIGSGERGFVDGNYAEAAFNDPQGLALNDNILYVADVGNHAIRAIDLETKIVSTLVGTGNQARTYPPTAGFAPNVDLSSPWDLTIHDNIMYIAMAGPHQLWRINLESGTIVPHAGSGRENIIDGPLDEAQLAQPSGIENDGTLLYFADSEVSAIRSASIDIGGDVSTIVGTGLFDFGDVDGVGDDVMLQHPLGVTINDDGMLYIADTYNNKIKMINPETRESITFAGDGTGGYRDGVLSEAQFYEPGGIDYADGKLYIADTNNHVIRVIDLESELVSTIDFVNTIDLLPAPVDDDENTFIDAGDEVVVLDAQTVAVGKGALVFDVTMPEGYKLNELAPFTVLLVLAAIR